jgi:4-hydroxy 2-oxovalerate aldolase
MGRGAGNLKLELLLIFLKKYYSFNVQLNYLQRVTALFQNLLDKYGWGTNLPYMIAGVNSFPQKDVMNWIQTKVISLETMVNSICDENVAEFEVETTSFPQVKQVLLVGGGDSVGIYIKYILSYLSQNPEIQIIFSSPKHISIFKEVSNKKYLSIIGDEGKDLDYSRDDLCLFLPSSHKNVKINLTAKVGTKISRLPENKVFLTEYPNHLANCANLISLLTPSKIYVVGYDGYFSGPYFENGLYDTNSSIFQSLSHILGFELLSLTPSKYKTLKEYSLFYLIE